MKGTLLFLLLTFFTFTSFAVEQHLEFSHLNLPNNISSKSVKTIVEDAKGYLWLGTTRGLYRYDGYNYKKKDDKSIHKILSTKDGLLWIAAYDGLYTYDIHSEKISKVKLPIERHTTHNVAKTSRGEIVLGSSKGLFIIDQKTRKVKHYQKVQGLDKGLSSDIVRVIYEDKKQNLWIGTHDNLNYFDREKGKFTNFRLQDKNEINKKNNLILDIIPLQDDNDDILLIGTETGLAIFNTIDHTFKKIHHSTTNKNSLTNEVVKSLLKVSDEEIWVGTGNGLNIYNPKTNKINRFYSSYTNHFSISDDIVHTFYKDCKDRIWLGTSNGVDFISRANHNLMVNKVPGSKKLMKMGTTITNFAFDHNGNVWFATTKQGLIKYTKKTDSYTYYKTPQILHSDVKDVLIDKAGNIWVATPGGLNVIDGKTTKIHAYTADWKDPDALKTNYLSSLSMSLSGDIWLGSMRGLYKVNQEGNHKLSFKLFKHDENNKNSISGNYIRDVLFNNEDNLWVLSGNGLDYFNLETGSIEHIKRPENSEYYFVNSIDFIDKDNAWIAIGKHIYQYHIPTKKYTLIKSAKSAIRNFAAINNQLWYTTSIRLFQYDLETKTEKIYSSELTGIENYKHYSIATNENNIYLGGENAFLTFNPNEVTLEAQLSNVTLTSLEISNKKVKKGRKVNGKVIIDKPFDEIKKLELGPEENSFTINFSTLDFRKDNALQYYAKLEGLEDQWKVLEGNRNFVSYNKVKPGEYVFKVKVTDSFGKVIDDSVTVLAITITPPIWATWWAKVSYFIILCVVFYIAHRVTVSNIHFQNQFELEKIKREQDDEVHQMKLKFFTNVSHELRTPLTLITSPLEELKVIEDDRQKQKLLEIITRNTKRLSRLVNQVLDLRKLDQGAEKLALSSNDMIKLTRNIVHDFMDAALQRSINLNFYTGQKESNFLFDFEKMEKVIYNLITNALKYTPDNGEIRVKLDQVMAKHPDNEFPEQNCQRISVKDSGIGISKEVQDQIFERFVNVKIENFIGQQGTGIGLSLVNDYVKMHNGWIDLKSVEGEGTEFIVYLPMEVTNAEEEEVIEDEVIEEENIENATEEESIESEEAEVNTKAKLLIIEDDTDMLSFLVHCFESDYQVITAKNGKEGWDKAKKQMPDLIISDWMMPEMNGVELCNKLKGNILTNHIPVIILTAKGGMENKMEGIEKGADDYISKPFNVEYLRVRVQNIINQRVKLNEKIKRDFGSKEEEDKMPTFEQKFLNEIIAEIEKNIDNSEFNVKALGECIGMGQTNLYRKVKSMTGMTVNELIRTVRLKKAEQLLKSGEYNVTDVMYMVGFTHRSYFSRSFKDMFGISPKQFTKHQTSEATMPQV